MCISLVYYLQDGIETVPTRLQDRTDAECYTDFKDEYEGEVGRMMVKYGEQLTEKASQRPDTKDKKRRLAFAERIKSKFPSLSWYILQKPAEVCPMNDHSTGEIYHNNFECSTMFRSLSSVRGV